MVSLITNRPCYAADIAEILRAYLGMEEITPADSWEDAAPYAVEALLTDDGRMVSARGKRTGFPEVSYSWSIDTSNDNALIRKRKEKRAFKIAVFRVMRQLEPEVSLPWGSLTGIRPTKLLRELCGEMGGTAALRMFREDFDVRPEKAALVSDILRAQRDILAGIGPKDADVYIGIPFCKTRCLYCSFASEVVDRRGIPTEYLDALYRDIELGAAIAKEGGYRIRSMYVGGGTPTVLTSDQLESLIAHALSYYGGCGGELTVEAGRPDTVDEEKLRTLRKMGVQRISLNPQTMQADTLSRIGRAHTPEEIVKAFHMARDIGFDSINMDVIAGLPGETPDDMRRTLEAISALRPDNLTVHTLAVKRSSRLKLKMEEYPLPAPADAERMVELGAQCAAAMQMHPYYMYRQKYMRGNLENVGYAAPGKDCIYNVDMMEEAASIFAHGAGAMTKCVFQGRDLRVERIPAPKDIASYIGKLPALDMQKRALFLQDTV
ncbi:MAG: coproporphyrinogen dehydrogenase HemZ [Bacillota bacterium]